MTADFIVHPGFSRLMLDDLAHQSHEDAVAETKIFENHEYFRRCALAGGDNPADVAELVIEIRRLQGTTNVEILRKAAAGSFPPSEDGTLTSGYERSPRWGSGIEDLDRSEAGGMYGVTVLGGEAGVAKSIVALGSSLLAARAGWRTIYCNFELDSDEISRRIGGFLGSTSRDCLKMWSFINLFQGCSFQGTTNDIAYKVSYGDERVLIVIDSINSFVRKQSKREYFAAIDEIVGWAETCVRKTHGHIGFILVSELAQAGNIKGGTTEYVCSLSLRMKHAKDQNNVIDVSTEKGREGGGYRKIGSYSIDHHQCKLVPLPDTEKPEPQDHTDPHGWDEPI